MRSWSEPPPPAAFGRWRSPRSTRSSTCANRTAELAVHFVSSALGKRVLGGFSQFGPRHAKRAVAARSNASARYRPTSGPRRGLAAAGEKALERAFESGHAFAQIGDLADHAVEPLVDAVEPLVELVSPADQFGAEATQ